MAEQEHTSTSGVLLSFLLGGLAGAAVAVLFAPRPGEATRELIADRMKDGIAKGRDLKEQAVSRSHDIRDEAVDFLEERKERLGSAIEAGHKAYKGVGDRV